MKKYLFFSAMLSLYFIAQGCKVTVEDLNDLNDSSLPFVGKRLQMSRFVLSPPVDFDGDGVVDDDLMKYLPDCTRDDVMIFEKSGKLSGSGGSVHCPDEKLPAADAHWTFDKSTSKLKMVDGTKTNEWQVTTMNENILTVKAPLVNNGVSYNAVLTMTIK